MDFSKTLIRCSSLGKLNTKPKSPKDGILSKTAKTHLIEVYADQKYNRRYDKENKYTKKGKSVEQSNITNLSVFTRRVFKKNERRVENGYFSGEFDIYEGESPTSATLIVDIKSSYDLLTFLKNIPDELDSDYYGQLQGYMKLGNCHEAWVAFILDNTPDSIYEGEKYALLKSLDVATEESPEAKEAIMQLYVNHHFNDIPLEERILIFKVERDEEYIKKSETMVEHARDFLAWFNQKHKNFNKWLIP